jgi:phage FluMu protein Com
MIQFRCEHCGHKLSVPDEHKGKRGKCPKCKNTLVVPKEEAAISAPQINYSVDLELNSVGDGTLTLMDVPEEYKLRDKPVAQSGSFEQSIEKEIESEVVEETESLGGRRMPRFIDVFLYPISLPGLMNLGIFVVIPFLISIVSMLLGPLDVIVGVPKFLINMAIGLYFFWYITE